MHSVIAGILLLIAKMAAPGCSAMQQQTMLEMLPEDTYDIVFYCDLNRCQYYEKNIIEYITGRYAKAKIATTIPKTIIELVGSDLKEVLFTWIIDAEEIDAHVDESIVSERNLIEVQLDEGKVLNYKREEKAKLIILAADNAYGHLQEGVQGGSIGDTGERHRDAVIYSLSERSLSQERFYLALQQDGYMLLSDSLPTLKGMIDVGSGEALGFLGSEHYQQIEKLGKELGPLWEVRFKLVEYELVEEKEVLGENEDGIKAKLERMRRYEDLFEAHTFILEEELLIDRIIHVYSSEEAANMYTKLYGSDSRVETLLSLGNMSEEDKRAIRKSGAGLRVFIEDNILYRDTVYTKELLRHLNKQYQEYLKRQDKEEKKKERDSLPSAAWDNQSVASVVWYSSVVAWCSPPFPGAVLVAGDLTVEPIPYGS